MTTFFRPSCTRTTFHSDVRTRDRRIVSDLDLGGMRTALSGHDFGEVSLQNIGSPEDVMIRIQVSESDDQAAVTARDGDPLTNGRIPSSLRKPAGLIRDVSP